MQHSESPAGKTRLPLLGAIALAVAAAVLGFAVMAKHLPWGGIVRHAMFVPDPRSLFGKSSIRVLVVGLDYDYTDADQPFSAHSRSDIIMALNLDFTNQRVYELSVPRDMVATLPDGRRAKINQAQSDGGIAESQAVVSQWLGVPGFDRYVVLRINTTKDLIDAVGGVDVVVKNSDALVHQGPNGPINYDDTWGHLHVHLKPGLQHLDGAQAVGYARFRHDWCSDPCRIMRQQQVVKAIVAKLGENKVNTLLHAHALIDVVRRDVETNVTADEALAIGMAFAGIDATRIHTAQVPYVGDIDLPGYGDSIIPDTAKRARLVHDMLLDPPQPSASPAPTPSHHRVSYAG
ncbi:LytR family transcriptional regulator [bacterium]|nr:MAG: LytR family transcriptional regulator [bacterium]